MISNRSVVLGLCSFTHDSAAALFVDGALVGFVEEERLSGMNTPSSTRSTLSGGCSTTAAFK